MVDRRPSKGYLAGPEDARCDCTHRSRGVSLNLLPYTLYRLCTLYFDCCTVDFVLFLRARMLMHAAHAALMAGWAGRVAQATTAATAGRCEHMVSEAVIRLTAKGAAALPTHRIAPRTVFQYFSEH